MTRLLGKEDSQAHPVRLLCIGCVLAGCHAICIKASHAVQPGVAPTLFLLSNGSCVRQW